MNTIKKFFKTFSFELISIALFSAISVILLFIHKIAALVAVAGVVIYAVTLVILFYTRKNTISDRDASGFANLVTGFVKRIDSPALVVNETNKIVWHNDEFGSLSEVLDKHATVGMGKLFGGALSYLNIANAYDEYIDFIPIQTDNSYYEARVFPLEYHSQKLFGAVLYSKNNEKRLKQQAEDSAIRVAYIVIDNTNEVTQEIQENRRFGSATVNKLLTEWASESSAILTEYDRDKYVMQFENRYLQAMIDSRFDIIDKVVEHSLGESPIPITISIGVSSEEGTLLEKRESAQSALRSALQRGGAMAVVRTSSGEDSYGGHTKAVQRQTKIRSRLCKDLLCDNLQKCSNVIIMGHLLPDFDSIASNIGIAKLVQSYNKDYYIVADRNDKNITKVFETISVFPEYDSVFVDAEYAQEKLTSETLVIITDVSNPELFAAPGVYNNASKVIVIDHHAKKEALGEQVLQPSNIDPTASSASELVCEILELSVNPNAIRPEEAQLLLAGILLDTQFFSRDTSSRTYSACSFLKNVGAEAGKAKNLFKSDMNQFRAVSKIGQNMQVYRDKYAISVYVDNTNPENKVTASKAADNLIEIDGISASFVLYSLENGINLSARSDGTINVINIAKSLGGGGHFQSAGALIKYLEGKNAGAKVLDVNEAIEILKKAIDEYIGGSSKEGKTI